jgi:uncharacterized caspase-like protein
MFKKQVRLKLSIVLIVAANLGVLPGCNPAYGLQRGARADSKQPQRGVTPVDSAVVSATPAGSYYALVIGNNEYKYVNKLQTAVNDAQAVARMLKENYGFETKVLPNATRDQVLTAMSAYRHTLPRSSNLLIYYAGHGYLDREADEAYWFPVDAQSDNSDHWISASDITSAIRTIPSMHILIISDSCYSGALMRDVEPTIRPSENSAYIAKMLASKSRNLMSSGGVEPVADGGGGDGHSIFANALLESLSLMEEKEFTAADLFQKFVKRGVAGRSKQVPQYSFIRDSGDEFGDFIFYRAKGKAPASATHINPLTNMQVDVSLTDMDVPNKNARANNVANNSARGSDVDAINDVIQRYQEAYNQRDPDALWQIWPDAGEKNKQSIENSFKNAKSIEMSLTKDPPKIAPDGQTATIKCKMSYHYVFMTDGIRPVDRKGDDTAFTLKKNNGTWVIADTK